MSVLVFLIPFRGKRGKPVELFEDSQRRMRQHLEQYAETVTTYEARPFLDLAHSRRRPLARAPACPRT